MNNLTTNTVWWRQILEYRKHNVYRIASIMLRFVFNRKVMALLVLLVLMLTFFSSQAQQKLTLKMCHESADSLYPVVFQKQKLAQINELALENLKAKYLPEIGFNARATYQSKVTEMPVAMPGVSAPAVPLEQFSATIDVSQVIYDGGAVKSAKQVAEMQTKAGIQQVEVNMYKLKEQINNLYFLSMALQENEKILNLVKANIEERKKILKSAVDNGMVNISELDNLEAELLGIEQQAIELNTQREQAMFALKELSCINLPENVELELPSVQQKSDGDMTRPEYKLYADNIAVLNANAEVIKAERMPKVAAFGSGGVGYPGLNMFSGAMEPYFIVGAQLKWTVTDWKQAQRKQEQLSVKKASVSDSENVFNKQLTIQQKEEELKQHQLEQLIEKDYQIIELRKRITERSASQLENGIINSADYIQDLNAEKQAMISLETHKIQLAQAKLNAVYLSGKPVF